MACVSLIGCGFVADLYMKSLRSFPDIRLGCVYDHIPERAQAFGAHWDVRTSKSLEEFFETQHPETVILNLTNPSAHYEINRQILEAGFHTYSEKPLAMSMAQAQTLYDLAQTQGLMLASAPCSILGIAGQTLLKAVRDNIAGTPRLVYAELDDGFIPQAPYRSWHSESGAPWPYEDEFKVGCTLEHAGYCLSWLIALFGSVHRVVAASVSTVSDLLVDDPAPDMSVAVLFFESGVTARLTCSIVAPHNHSVQIIGDAGVLRVDQVWSNTAPVKFHRRFSIRRRLMEHPYGKRVKSDLAMPPSVRRTGAAAMNFALGPVEMIRAQQNNRPCRLSAELALHLNEVTLAIHNAGSDNGLQVMQTRCSPMELTSWSG